MSVDTGSKHCRGTRLRARRRRSRRDVPCGSSRAAVALGRITGEQELHAVTAGEEGRVPAAVSNAVAVFVVANLNVRRCKHGINGIRIRRQPAFVNERPDHTGY